MNDEIGFNINITDCFNENNLIFVIVRIFDLRFSPFYIPLPQNFMCSTVAEKILIHVFKTGATCNLYKNTLTLL